MKTTWNWSIESEANRLIQTLHNVGNGFYTAHHFSVLPLEEPYTDTSVQLPSLNYQSIKDLWLRLRDVDIKSLPATDPHDLTPELIPLLPPLSSPVQTKTKALWDRSSLDILRAIERELPGCPPISSLTIHPTYFGTQVSFNHIHTTRADIVIYLRLDATLHHLVEAIVSSLLRPFHNKQGLSWNESEAIIDHITTNSPLSLLLRRLDPTAYRGTIAPLNLSSAPSINLLEKIGAPTQHHSFTISDQVPHVDNHPIHHLTGREAKVLGKLIELNNKTIPYDEIADLIFENDDDYSLAVIGKVIERLRVKLEKNGINGSLIGTDRKLGYFLKN